VWKKGKKKKSEKSLPEPSSHKEGIRKSAFRYQKKRWSWRTGRSSSAANASGYWKREWEKERAALVLGKTGKDEKGWAI